MASSIWTISIAGGAAVQLDTLGITNPVVQRVAGDVGTLQFVIKKSSVLDNVGMAYGQQVSLLRNGSCFFVGRIRGITQAFDSGAVAYGVRVCDTWWELERTIYRQTAIAWGGAGNLSSYGYLSSRVALNQDAWGRKYTVYEQLRNALIYAAYNNPGTVGGFSVPSGFQFAAEETREVPVSEVIRRCVSLNPGQTPFSLYLNGIWQLGWTFRGYGPNQHTLDLSTGNLVLGANLQRRLDSVPPGVVIDFLKPVTKSTGDVVQSLTRDYAGFPGRAGTIYATIQLGECDTVPFGVAAAYYNSLFTAQWQGSVRIQEADCTGFHLTPGNTLNLVGGRTEWTTMNAMVKACTYELETGITTAELGAPEVLSVEDFVDQIGRWRMFPQNSAICKVNNNGEDGKGDGVDDEGQPTVPPPNAPDPANPDAGGDGVSGSATAPKGVGSNPDAGRPNSAVRTQEDVTSSYFGRDLTLCDGSHITVLVQP